MKIKTYQQNKGQDQDQDQDLVADLKLWLHIYGDVHVRLVNWIEINQPLLGSTPIFEAD